MDSKSEQSDGFLKSSFEIVCEESSCGIGTFRPVWLRRFADVRLLTVILTLWGFTRTLIDMYIVSVLSTIEKDFGLSSFLSGILKNADNIGFMIVVVFVNHVFRNSNQSRLFSAAMLMMSLGCIIMALPHFLFEQKAYQATPLATNNAAGNNFSTILCNTLAPQKGHICLNGSPRRYSTEHRNMPSFFVFLFGQLVTGVAGAVLILSVSHLDDNVSKRKSPAYLAVMLSCGRAMAPLVGQRIGVWAISKHVTLKAQSFNRKDPRWIGAWWLGFFLIGIVNAVLAIPMIMFPRTLDKGSRKLVPQENISGKLKDLPRAIARVMKNPVYPFILLATCCNLVLVGYTTFLPKYLEVQFQLSVSQARTLQGLILTIASLLGPMISGFVMSRARMTTPRTLKWICIFISLATLAIVFSMMIECENPIRFPGFKDFDSCNRNCSCADVFHPVCGSNNIQFPSACHAGCSSVMLLNNSSNRKVFSNCSCIPLAGRATEGLCRKACNYRYLYIAIVGLVYLLNMLCVIPSLSAILRSVSVKDKAIAVTGSFAPMSLSAFVGPVIFGSVIDSACLFLGDKCSGKGACLAYDRKTFRISFHALAVVVKTVTLILYFLAWRGARILEAQRQLQLDDCKDVLVNNVQPRNDFSKQALRLAHHNCDKSPILKRFYKEGMVEGSTTVDM